MQQQELLLVEDVLWLLAAPTGLPVYDFDFSRFFTCRHPWQRPDRVTGVARVGVYDDYAKRYRELAEEGFALVHSPEDHLLISELPNWYTVLEDVTPKSICFDTLSEAGEAANTLGWPIFLKGQRQTSRHRRALSIIEGPEAFKRAMEAYAEDPILRWQKIVCREYVSLRPVEDSVPDRIPSSFEFRTFWWKGELVGLGQYWWEGKPYSMTDTEKQAALAIAREAAGRLQVTFLVVDVAQTIDGRWIVIECNDGQESGYAGVPPLAMWENILQLEKHRQ